MAGPSSTRQAIITADNIDAVLKKIENDKGISFPDKPKEIAKAARWAGELYQSIITALASGHRTQEVIDRILIPLLDKEPSAKFKSIKSLEMDALEGISAAFQERRIKLSPLQQAYVHMQLGFGTEGDARANHFHDAYKTFLREGFFARASNAARHTCFSLLALGKFSEAGEYASAAIESAERGTRVYDKPKTPVITDPYYQCHFFLIAGRCALAQRFQAEAFANGLDKSPSKTLLKAAEEWFMSAQTTLSKFPENEQPLIGGSNGKLMLLPGAMLRAHSVLMGLVNKDAALLEATIKDGVRGAEYAHGLHAPPTMQHVYVQEQVVGLAMMAKAVLTGEDLSEGLNRYNEASAGLRGLGNRADTTRFQYLKDFIDGWSS